MRIPLRSRPQELCCCCGLCLGMGHSLSGTRRMRDILLATAVPAVCKMPSRVEQLEQSPCLWVRIPEEKVTLSQHPFEVALRASEALSAPGSNGFHEQIERLYTFCLRQHWRIPSLMPCDVLKHLQVFVRDTGSTKCSPALWTWQLLG